MSIEEENDPIIEEGIQEDLEKRRQELESQLQEELRNRRPVGSAYDQEALLKDEEMRRTKMEIELQEHEQKLREVIRNDMEEQENMRLEIEEESKEQENQLSDFDRDMNAPHQMDEHSQEQTQYDDSLGFNEQSKGIDRDNPEIGDDEIEK